MQSFIANPKEKCEAAISYLIKEVQNYPELSNVRARATGIWANANKERNIPMNHYVLVVTYRNDVYVPDPTIAQFSERLNINTPYTGKESDWLNIYQKIAPSKGVAKFKDFNNMAEARYYPQTDANPYHYIEGEFLLNEPRWPRTCAQTLQKVDD